MKKRTIAKEGFFTGMGLFTGKEVRMRLLPSRDRIGFSRIDLPKAPITYADLKEVVATNRSTSLNNVRTVEHFLSAAYAYGIDSLLVEIDGPELPCGDGSALPFVHLFEECGFQELPEKKEMLIVKKPLYLSSGDTHLVALPSEELSISYTAHYPHCSYIRSQYYSFTLKTPCYKTEIAPCRTFCLYEEIEPLLQRGVIKGGGLDKAVVIKEGKILNTEGLRFFDEMVRHKILDLIGDLALLGRDIQAHILAIRSGHSTNVSFAKMLEQSIMTRSL